MIPALAMLMVGVVVGLATVTGAVPDTVVTVPPVASVAGTQAVPFHCKTWLLVAPPCASLLGVMVLLAISAPVMVASTILAEVTALSASLAVVTALLVMVMVPLTPVTSPLSEANCQDPPWKTRNDPLACVPPAMGTELSTVVPSRNDNWLPESCRFSVALSPPPPLVPPPTSTQAVLLRYHTLLSELSYTIIPASGFDTADLLVTTGRINPCEPFPLSHRMALDFVVAEPMATSFWAYATNAVEMIKPVNNHFVVALERKKEFITAALG